MYQLFSTFPLFFFFFYQNKEDKWPSCGQEVITGAPTSWNKTKFHSGSKENRNTEFVFSFYILLLKLSNLKSIYKFVTCKCTRKDHLKLAAAQIKCITSTVTAPLFLLLKKLSNFKWERKYKTNFAFITFQTQWCHSLNLGSLTLNLDTVYYQEQPPEKTSKSRIQSKRRCQ